MRIEEYKSLAPLTTLGIGGPARWFVRATTEEDIAAASVWAREHAHRVFVLGGGSNLLVSDAGFPGLVLHVALRGISTGDTARCRVYRAAAGEDWDALVERTVHDNCAGLECLAGIPGTVGGTPVQNVGAYGQDVASVIDTVRAFDQQQRDYVHFTAAECAFAYRSSRFNSADSGRYIVTRVDFQLTPGGPATLRYADLQRAFSEGASPSLAEVAGAVRRIRHSKGMLIVEGDPDCRSAGSFFKNPLVNEEQLHFISTVAGAEPPQFPAGPEPEHAGKLKIPAAWLIEQSGFFRGYAKGAAGISSRHTLAIINRGGAVAADVLALVGQIQAAVASRFQIHLEIEPVMVGFDHPTASSSAAG